MRRVETQSIRDVAIGKLATEVVGDQRFGALLAATHDDFHGNAVITDAALSTAILECGSRREE
jgi:hypothetical protein